MNSRQVRIWASVLAAIVLIPLGTLLVVNEFFTDYRERVTPWEPMGLTDGGRTVVVKYSTCRGSAQSFDRVDRDETPSTVTLTVILQENPRRDCEDIATYHTTEVELARPLGSRLLIDGRTGAKPDFERVTPQSR
jgi:hypothetical protein